MNLFFSGADNLPYLPVNINVARYQAKLANEKKNSIINKLTVRKKKLTV